MQLMLLINVNGCKKERCVKSNLIVINNEEYLKYNIQEELINELQFLMLEKNNIEGLINFKKLYLEGELTLMYKLETCISLRKYYQKGSLNDEKIIDIFLDINKVIISLKDYFLLENKNLDLNIDNVYFDYVSKKIKLIYIPIESDLSLISKYKKFINKFMGIMSVEDSYTRFVNDLRGYLDNQFFSLKGYDAFLKEEKLKYSDLYIENENKVEIKKEIKEESKEDIYNAKNYSENKMSLANYSNKENREKMDRKKVNILKKTDKEGKKSKKDNIFANIFRLIALQIIGVLIINLIFDFFSISSGMFKVMVMIVIELIILIAMYFIVFNKANDLIKMIRQKDNKNEKKNEKLIMKKESNILYNSDETCFSVIDNNRTEFTNNSNEKSLFKAYLLIKDEGSEEKILIDKKNFIIGREKENCDYYISDKRISKMHFAIIKYEKEFFIKDLNSTNGTYLNGELIEKNKLAKIINNDLINISNKEYIFKIN